jgi:hypothetical protein
MTLRHTPENLNPQNIWLIKSLVILISGFRRDVDVICGLLGNYTASCGNYLPTFRDNVSVPSSRVKFPRRRSWKFEP